VQSKFKKPSDALCNTIVSCEHRHWLAMRY